MKTKKEMKRDKFLKKKKIIGNITPEFQKWVDEFMSEHEDALRELAKR